MGLISFFVALFVGFMIVGFIAAIFDRDKDESDDRSNIVMSQEVPSVFDAFKNDGGIKK